MNDADIKTKIANTWNEEANFYDTHVSHGIQTEDEKKLWMEAFRKILPKDENLSILDVGCGTGAMGLILAEMGHMVTGVDLSEGMMEIGRKKAEKLNLSMTFQNGDAEAPPFSENYFDAVVNRHLLWTLPNPNTALKSWFDVVKPGGVVLVIDGVWDDGSFGAKIRRWLSSAIAKIVERHPHGEKGYSEEVKEALPNRGGVPKEQAEVYFKDAGFSKISVLELTHIRENQRKRLKWYQKLNKNDGYYIIFGRKSE